METLIRFGRLDDAESILEIQKAVVLENDYLILSSEEFDRTIEQTKNWISKILKNDRDTIIVAEIEGGVIGWIVFQSKDFKRLSHTGCFTTMVHKDYRGMGIGKMLVGELLNWADRTPLIEKICLGVLSTNLRAITLYKSLGFVEEGRKVNEVKINENEYVDDLLMYKLVSYS